MITADLKGKKALVTGGASGIGLATVEKLAGCGAAVAINDLPGSERLGREVARLHRLDREVHAAPGDVGNPAEAGRMVHGVSGLRRPADFADSCANGDSTRASSASNRSRIVMG